MDLGDLYAGVLSLRRLCVIVRHLPHTAELHRLLRRWRRDTGTEVSVSIEDLPPDVYAQTDWLLLAVHDELVKLRHITHQHSLVQAGSKKRLPAPEFLPRPGAIPKRRRALNAWFGAAGLTNPPT